MVTALSIIINKVCDYYSVQNDTGASNIISQVLYKCNMLLTLLIWGVETVEHM